MTKRMLIDASHAEETRVVVLDGSRLEDFDVETSTKRQLKGNIYLAKVVRVEPSLQAAFVEYGGNRHGFLAFSEIHPDYYQIPIADRQRLIEMQAEEARREEEEDDLELALTHAVDAPGATEAAPHAPAAQTPALQTGSAETGSVETGSAQVQLAQTGSAQTGSAPASAADALAAEPWALAATPPLIAAVPRAEAAPPPASVAETGPPASAAEAAPPMSAAEAWATASVPPLLADPLEAPHAVALERLPRGQIVSEPIVEDESDTDDRDRDDANGDPIESLPPPETVGGSDHESSDDQRERRMPPRFMRNYKIQEVIRRRQILLIQVVKEERGTKGAALTTYLSLAGRFGVLMPNSPRGGGISRKITSATDRRRLKEVMAELDIPRGMGMIVRTAGANRPKPEIKRDCEYLLRLWDDIRDHTMKSVAPALIYEEASLIKRAIRDVYSRDIDEILVDGEDGWHAAHDFMRMLMPTHAKKVQLWRDGGQPLFARNQVEAQLDGMLMPTVQLRSGGYLVINQAEALVAIDVNSGRSTRERNVEETALRTNLEAADEVARQLRLRDLAGLIVIDFIDMESKRHNAMVERRIKEALKNDRARIQVGHISHFGLLEMSRQRLRPSLAETSFILCPHCGGTGHVRSTENAAIHVLRGIEDEGSKRRSAEIVVHVSSPVALYLLNHKRERLQEIELRYAMRVIIAADDAQIAPQFRIEKLRTRSPDEVAAVVTAERPLPLPAAAAEDDEDRADAAGAEDEDDDSEDDSAEQRAEDAGAEDAGTEDGGTEDGGAEDGGTEDGGDDADRRRKRRRRRRRGGRRDGQQPAAADTQDGAPAEPTEAVPATAELAASRDPAELADPGEATESGEPGEPSGDEAADPAAAPAGADDDPRNRRRGRRGGRRRRRDNETELPPMAVPGADQPELTPVYAGPTPADPFGGRAFDIFDVMDQAERAAEAQPPQRAASAAEIVNNTAPDPEASDIDPATVGATSADPAASDARGTQPTAAEIINSAAPEPAAESPLPPTEPAPPPAVPANDTAAADINAEPAAAEPLVRPILIGAGGEPPAEPKRGWWRR
ncbi:Rne/Rng family ribonuclease [Rhodopila sp.]|uniref:Rne/Rng family ribonuclease n=1 Tax=Rhodopila sp. TaxID=2480087 RepID=UPI003D0D12EF